VIVVILIAFFSASWCALVVGFGVPPQIATTALAAATGLALRVAAGPAQARCAVEASAAGAARLGG
jgi:hypothetical protein